MNLLSRLNPFSTKSADIIDTSEQLASMLGTWYESDAGITITSANALQISTVYQCVRVLAESIGMLPLFLMTDIGEGKAKAKKHPLYRLLKTAPNDYQTAQEYKELIIAHLCLRGNHYSYINKVNGKVLELLPLAPSAVMPKLRDDYTVEYQVTFKNGKVETLEQSDVLHFKLFSTDGLTGLSPISMGRNALGLLKATEAHGSSLFKNGANPFGGFKTDKNLTNEQFKGLKDQLSEHQGSGNGFKPLILEGGLEWIQVAITPEQAQFLETRKFQRSEVCGLFRVPPHMIGDLERATFSNIEHQGLEFVTSSLMPYLTRIENRANVSLLTPDEQVNYEFKFNVNALLRGDMKSRAEFYTKLLQNGALSPNEIRAKEDMNPREGGDIFLTPLNMAVNGQPIGDDTNANKE